MGRTYEPLCDERYLNNARPTVHKTPLQAFLLGTPVAYGRQRLRRIVGAAEPFRNERSECRNEARAKPRKAGLLDAFAPEIKNRHTDLQKWLQSFLFIMLNKKSFDLKSKLSYSGGRTRTCGLRVMSPTSCQLLYPASNCWTTV